MFILIAFKKMILFHIPFQYNDLFFHEGDDTGFSTLSEEPDSIRPTFNFQRFRCQVYHFLYPGTGRAGENGRGRAAGTKLNIPLAPRAGDEEFASAWTRVEDFLDSVRPGFVLLQCGADGLSGDPITHLEYTEAVHRLVAARLCRLADEYCDGRILALGGGGYDLDNLTRAWCAVVRVFAGLEPE